MVQAFKCTHFVLYTSNLALSHTFYADILQCDIRAFDPSKILSVGLGGFIVNFQPTKELQAKRVVNHLGLEVPTQNAVNEWFKFLRANNVPMHLSKAQTIDHQELEVATLEQLQKNQGMGPYRFYICDPDGYTLEIHTWEGIEE